VRKAVKLITQQEYDVLVYAPDHWQPVPPSIDRRSLNALVKRGLVDGEKAIKHFQAERWRLNDYGRLMIEECKRAWKLQGELGL
jgi:hypothetical protein